MHLEEAVASVCEAERLGELTGFDKNRLLDLEGQQVPGRGGKNR